MSDRFPEGVWKVVEGVWKVVEGVWKVFGRCLEGVWELFGNPKNISDQKIIGFFFTDPID